MSWISIKDEFPEFGLPVLVCEKGNEKSVGICKLESVTNTKEGASCVWIEGSYDTWYHNVTHFQYLPKCAS